MVGFEGFKNVSKWHKMTDFETSHILSFTCKLMQWTFIVQDNQSLIRHKTGFVHKLLQDIF